MKIISNGKVLAKNLKRCIEKHDRIYMAVAWASVNDVFDDLLAAKHKIKKTTIGTHFYQTAPAVLEKFRLVKNVRFVRQTSGVFHPKVYLFESGEKWEAIIGSANFTCGALSRNQELSVLISDADARPSVKEKLLKELENYFQQGTKMSKNDISCYEIAWKEKQKSVRKLADEYGSSVGKKSAWESEIMSMSWENYVRKVKENEWLNERMELLAKCKKAFGEYQNFVDMPEDTKKMIAGLPNGDCEYYACFGHMKTAFAFKPEVRKKHPGISKAISLIPLEEHVSKGQYENFIDELRMAFPNGGVGIASATRLLAMKRPDAFVCLNSKNKEELRCDFGIKGTINLERYWDEIIERIMDSTWWSSEKPTANQEIWHARAALLDCLYY